MGGGEVHEGDPTIIAKGMDWDCPEFASVELSLTTAGKRMITGKVSTAEFRRQAIDLAAREDVGPIGAARDLGISTSVLYRWRLQAQKAGQAAFPGQGRTTLPPQEQESHRLRKEVEILRQEREILKKATAFFARENL